MTQQELFNKFKEENCKNCKKKTKDCEIRIRLDNTACCSEDKE